MGAACAAYGGCDFLLNLGDSFYDLGIASVNDPQWANGYLNVFAAAGIPNNTPILSTLGALARPTAPSRNPWRNAHTSIVNRFFASVSSR